MTMMNTNYRSTWRLWILTTDQDDDEYYRSRWWLWILTTDRDDDYEY